jgi:hypothetical protein
MGDRRYSVKEVKYYSFGTNGSAGSTVNSVDVQVILADAEGNEFYQVYILKKTGNAIRVGFIRNNSEISFMEGETSAGVKDAGKPLEARLVGLFPEKPDFSARINLVYGKYLIEQLGFYNGQPEPLNVNPEPAKTLNREEPKGHSNEENKRGRQGHAQPAKRRKIEAKKSG